MLKLSVGIYIWFIATFLISLNTNAQTLVNCKGDTVPVQFSNLGYSLGGYDCGPHSFDSLFYRGIGASLGKLLQLGDGNSHTGFVGTWISPDSLISNNAWSIYGNKGLTSDNVLGTTDGAPLTIQSGFVNDSLDAQTTDILLKSSSETDSGTFKIVVRDSIHDIISAIMFEEGDKALVLGTASFDLTQGTGIIIGRDATTFFNWATGAYYTLPNTIPNAGDVLTCPTGSGSLTWEPLPAIPTMPEIKGYHFSNGLSAFPDTIVKLGGELSQNTSISLNNNSFSLWDGQAGLFIEGDSTHRSFNYTGDKVYINSDSLDIFFSADSSTIQLRAQQVTLNASALNLYAGNNKGATFTDSSFTLNTLSRYNNCIQMSDSNALSHYKTVLSIGTKDSIASGGGFYVDNPRRWSAGFYNFIQNGDPKAQLFFGVLDSTNKITDKVRIEANSTGMHGRVFRYANIYQYNSWQVDTNYVQLDFDKTSSDGVYSGKTWTLQRENIGYWANGINRFKIDTSGNVTINDGTQGAGKVFTSDVNGTGSWQLNQQTIDTVISMGGLITSISLPHSLGIMPRAVQVTFSNNADVGIQNWSYTKNASAVVLSFSIAPLIATEEVTITVYK